MPATEFQGASSLPDALKRARRDVRTYKLSPRRQSALFMEAARTFKANSLGNVLRVDVSHYVFMARAYNRLARRDAPRRAER